MEKRLIIWLVEAKAECDSQAYINPANLYLCRFLKEKCNKMMGGSNPGCSEIFHTHPEPSWESPSHLHNGYRVSFPRVKRPRRGLNHQPPSSAEVKEEVELYLWAFRAGYRINVYVLKSNKIRGMRFRIYLQSVISVVHKSER